MPPLPIRCLPSTLVHMPFIYPFAGMWALHCHIDLHANSGMMMVMKVAAADAREPWSLPKGVTACGAQQNMWVLRGGLPVVRSEPAVLSSHAGEFTCSFAHMPLERMSVLPFAQECRGECFALRLSPWPKAAPFKRRWLLRLTEAVCNLARLASATSSVMFQLAHLLLQHLGIISQC